VEGKGDKSHHIWQKVRGSRTTGPIARFSQERLTVGASWSKIVPGSTNLPDRKIVKSRKLAGDLEREAGLLAADREESQTQQCLLHKSFKHT